ncbi:hypothetical protein EMMF5_005470 [Cystobasidiomycetes sp. EMM_F5]
MTTAQLRGFPTFPSAPVWPAAPSNQTQPYRNKHKHDELEDEENDGVEEGDTPNPADDGFIDGDQAPAASKARTTKRIKTSHTPLDFEPTFNAMSLARSDGPASLFPPSRISALETPRSERQSTPFPSSAESSPLRNTRRPVKEVRMQQDERTDPSRPHVVFVDSLTDSEDDSAADESTSTSRHDTDADLSSSDLEDGNASLLNGFGHAKRPLRLNSRLRQHLTEHSMPSQNALAKGLHAAGPGAVQERGLVLYRPLSFGIVEEPATEQDGLDDSNDGVEVEEIPVSPKNNNSAEIMTEDPEDASMEVD